MASAIDTNIPLLRHTLATVAYRGRKAVLGATPEFANFQACADARTPAQILAHMGDLFEWASGLAEGKHVWRNAAPLPWDQEIARFFSTLEKFDGVLAGATTLGFSTEQIFQGPIADALTHIGQLSLLRRMANCPVRGENYVQANIKTGTVGADQPKPVQEF